MEKNENTLLRYIMLSTAHLSHQDALTLAYLSDPIDSVENYTHEWIHSTGMHNGFIIRLTARADALEELRTRGISGALCSTLELLSRSLNVSMIHFDRNAELLTGLPVYSG
ncbi:hypothetical protein D0N50_22765 (plasmid) [Erwinia billingiae]|uniref:DUF5983 family protein n=1 Tax=Erwinia billingiae TaxID=182337 RepID=UPI0012449D3F|nr:DUF5983 family protein [Erwinia billingiae]QEW34545.1 hypothetical protein D0N50_22765 [Erwinia billingiae]